MANEVHVYRIRLSQMLLWTVIWLSVLAVSIWVVSLIPVDQLPSRFAFDVRIIPFIELGGLAVYWFLWLIRIPRVEVSARGIRYVNVVAALDAPWSDVQRMSSWRTSIWRYEGLIIRDPSFQLSALGKLSQNFSRSSKPLLLEPKIPLVPLFAGNLNSSAVGDEIRQYVPQILSSWRDL